MSSSPKMPIRELLHRMAAPYKQLFPYLLRYKWRFFFALLCGAGAGASQGAMAAVMGIVTNAVFGSGQRPGLRHMADAATQGPALSSMIGVCALIPLVMLVRGSLTYLNSFHLNWVSLKLLNDIRSDLFKKIIRHPLSFFNQRQSGMLIGHIMNDTRMAQMMLSQITSDLVTQPVALVGAIGVLFYTDWKFTIVSLFLFPVCLVPIIVFGRKVRKSGGNEEALAGMLMVILQEAFAGVRVIKALGREETEVAKFEESSEHQFRSAIRIRRAIEIVGPIIEAVSAVGAGLALLYVGMRGTTVGAFVTLIVAVFAMYDPAKKLSKIHMQLQKALASTERIFELMNLPTELSDAPDAVELDRVTGAVEFRDVSFRYRKELPLAVQGINLRIEPGKNYALVGQSGSGKSTLINLVLRFYDPQNGSITVDGHDLRQVTQKSLRENIAIVTQETFLFHTTILENIRYGRFDATEEEIQEAARLAYAHDFICEQAKGYQTVVGDKGCMLSGGQQQRISIARALLKNAPILLLDEATSALDSESEKQIQLALDRLSTGRTVIAIAHRLSTILNADQIVSMENGRIVEVGTHAELYALNGNYRKLYDLQFNSHETPEAGDDPLPVVSSSLSGLPALSGLPTLN